MVKPCYGKDIFGKIAAYKIAEEFQLVDTEILSDRDLYVFSDCGFDAEIHHVLKLFGNENALLIRISKEGSTYEGDSRSYIELPDVLTIDIHNYYEEYVIPGKRFNPFMRWDGIFTDTLRSMSPELKLLGWTPDSEMERKNPGSTGTTKNKHGILHSDSNSRASSGSGCGCGCGK